VKAGAALVHLAIASMSLPVIRESLRPEFSMGWDAILLIVPVILSWILFRPADSRAPGTGGLGQKRH